MAFLPQGEGICTSQSLKVQIPGGLPGGGGWGMLNFRIDGRITKAKFYLVNPSNSAKTEKIHGHITLEQEINPVQIPHPSASKATFKSPTPWARCTVKCLGYAWGGGGMLKLPFDRYISMVANSINFIEIFMSLSRKKRESKALF